MLNEIPPSTIAELRAANSGSPGSKQSHDGERHSPRQVRFSNTCSPAPSPSGRLVYVPSVIEHVPVDKIKNPKRVLKNHSARQIDALSRSIQAFGFIGALVIDRNNIVRAGAALLAAAKKIGLSEVPVIRVEHLSEDELRAFQIAHNKLAERSKWNYQELSLELAELSKLSLAEDEAPIVHLTGFEPAEVDEIVTDLDADSFDSADDITFDPPGNPISRVGDIWLLGSHKLCCADNRDTSALNELMKNQKADLAILDPPYNCRVADVVGRGHTKHQEFAMASGEMTDEEFATFLKQTLGVAASVSRDGAAHYVFMDWRNIEKLNAVGRLIYGALLNVIVWVKTNAGQGSFYRSQYELISVFRVGKSQHLNNIQLGKYGRSRSNVWKFAGANSFRAGRMSDLRAHPTVKPIALVCDIIRDCTRRGDTVLDTFCGSGTTILACERLGRHAIGIEIEPRYVDVAIRRWQEYSAKDAIHAETGDTFDQMMQRRLRVRVRIVS